MIRKQRTIYNLLVLVALYAATCAVGFGQGCPTIEILSPAGVTTPGESFRLKAVTKSTLGTIPSLKYDWTISGGTIEKGQGTDTLSMGTIVLDAGINITAKVSVSGLPPVCENVATEVIHIADVAIRCALGDEFGALKANDVKARVDDIYIVLNNNPDTFALFEVEYKDSETIQERKLRIRNILDAIKFRKYDLTKAVFLISNEKEWTITRVRILSLSTDMTYYINRGDLIYGQDMKQKLSTLFQYK